MGVKLFLSTEEFDPASIAIRLKTDCDYSHVGFIRTEDGWTFSAMADGKGVAWRPPNPRAKVLVLDCSAPEAVVKALEVAETQAGKPYNKLDILGIALDRDWSKPHEFICSTLVTWAFDQIHFSLVNTEIIPLEHITPRDILLSLIVSKPPA